MGVLDPRHEAPRIFSRIRAFSAAPSAVGLINSTASIVLHELVFLTIHAELVLRPAGIN